MAVRQFNMKLNEDEYSSLKRIAEATGKKESAVFKSILKGQLIDISIVYESLQKICSAADKGNYDKCKEECFNLCQIIASLSNL